MKLLLSLFPSELVYTSANPFFNQHTCSLKNYDVVKNREILKNEWNIKFQSILAFFSFIRKKKCVFGYFLSIFG